MKINVFQTASTTNHEGSANLVRLLQNLPNDQIIQTFNYAWIERNQQLKEHIHHDCIEYYFFLEGNGEMKTGGEKFAIQKGDFVTVEAGVTHTIVNTGNNKLEFVTLRAKI